VTAEPHGKAKLPRQLPRVAVFQPGVGDLNLPPVPNVLLEDAVLVADAVADGGNFERGERIHITRRQPAKAAVAQPRLLLGVEDRVQIQPQRRDGLADAVPQFQIEDVVGEVRSHEELGGEVGDRLRATDLVELA
jgi:hypothetical protein